VHSDSIVFLCSAILFTLLNGADIAEYTALDFGILGPKSLIISRNGKYTLAGSIAVIIFVSLSQRISLEAFSSYIPIFVALSLLVTTHVVPWLRAFSQQRNAITLGDYVMATRGDRSRESTRAAVYPFSIRSLGVSPGNLNQDLELGSHPLDFDHMGAGQYLIRIPDSPDHPSSVDLESELHEETESSTAPTGSRDPCL